MLSFEKRRERLTRAPTPLTRPNLRDGTHIQKLLGTQPLQAQSHLLKQTVQHAPAPFVRGVESLDPKQSSSGIGPNTALNLETWRPQKLSLDCTGDRVVVGGRKAVVVINLRQTSKPENELKIGQESVSALDCNPHSNLQSQVALAINHTVMIWDTKVASTSNHCVKVYNAHTSAISDLSWSYTDANSLASCSSDTYVHIWDMRVPLKAVRSFCAWTAEAVQVRWNKSNPNILASAHGSHVRVWDLRGQELSQGVWQPSPLINKQQQKGSTPAYFIDAHKDRVTSIDWNPRKEEELVTCGDDKTMKFWDVLAQPEPTLVGEPLKRENSVTRARYTPFGEGIVTLSPRSDNQTTLHSLNNMENPVAQFEGSVRDFGWRVVRGYNGEATDYQFIALSRDHNLLVWRLDKRYFEACGEKNIIGAPSSAVMAKQSFSKADDLLAELREFASEFKPYVRVNMLLHQRRVTLEIVESVRKGHQQKKMRTLIGCILHFPPEYPIGSPPSLTLQQSTDVDVPRRVLDKVQEGFEETARESTQKGHPCVHTCMRRVVDILNEQLSVSIGAAHDISTRIPCPRTAGVSFGPRGNIVYFNNFPGSTFHMEVDAPRTYQQLLNLVDTTADTILPMDPSSMFHDGKVARGSGYLEDPSEGRNVASMIDGRVGIHDVVNQFSYDLACAYRVHGPIVEVCEHNRLCALNRNSLELANMWGYLKTIAEESLLLGDMRDVSSHVSPWQQHPLVRGMIDRILSMLASNKDVQNLGVVMCVLSPHNVQTLNQEGADREEQVLGVPKARSLQSIQALVAHSESQSNSEHQSGPLTKVTPPTDGTKSPKVTSTLPPRPQSVSPSAKKIKQQQQGQVAVPTLLDMPPPAMSASARRPVNRSLDFDMSSRMAQGRRVASSPSLSSMVANQPQTDRGGLASDGDAESLFLLISRSQWERFKSSITQYAEILFRCRLTNKRAEVLKMLRLPAQVDSRIEVSRQCPSCSQPTQGQTCHNHRRVCFSCSLCHLPVRGLSSVCLACNHGGHAEHMRQWFATEKSCPAGCGCTCTGA